MAGRATCVVWRLPVWSLAVWSESWRVRPWLALVLVLRAIVLVKLRMRRAFLDLPDGA